jgi:hypothetical protein
MGPYYYSTVILVAIGFIAWKRGEKARNTLRDEVRLKYSDYILKNKFKYMSPYIVLWVVITALSYNSNINYEYLFASMFLAIILIIEVSKFVFFKRIKDYGITKEYYTFKKQQIILSQFSIVLYLIVSWSWSRLISG